MTQLFYNEHGYRKCREARLRCIAGSRECLAGEAANQIKHLKQALKEIISIVEIHSRETGNNFAWAELDFAKEAISVTANE
ncbi:MAG TPA: hypothetical protein VFF56_05895 [Bacillota bacterium]|nr:hypothetical protein [Bacillota bacterium]